MEEIQMQPKEPTLIRIREGEKEVEVPLLDVEEVLKLHNQEYPMVIMVAGMKQALVFKILSKGVQDEINLRYGDWLINYFYDAYADIQRIKEKKFGDRSMEEKKKLEEFQMESWPYLTEISHAMLYKPEMSLDIFREIMEAAGTVEWTRVSLHCKEILTPLLKDPKNS